MGCVQVKCCCKCQFYSDDEEEDGIKSVDDHEKRIPKDDPTENLLHVATVPSHNIQLEYAYLTQKGHYPDSPDRENQDNLRIKTQLQGNPNLHFFGVFDGHGQFGAQCSNFVKERLVDILSSDPHLLDDPIKAYTLAFHNTNIELHNSEIDDSMSGTTAITVLVHGDTLFVANVGDSRAVAGVWNGNSFIAQDLSSDQTPFRQDEYERVKLCGARVLTVDQVEGIKDPTIQNWGDEESDEGDPPRLWVQNGMYPGTAFTRSVGDSTAESIGVTAEPEILTVKITPNLAFFVIASDGVFEFLSSQAVIDMVANYADPRDACSTIVAESYKLWLEHETRTDDITIIVVRIKGLCDSGAAASSGVTTRLNTKPATLMADKGSAERNFSVDKSTVGRCVNSVSTIHLSTHGNSSNLHGFPTDVRAERGPACVAPSPTHLTSSALLHHD